MKTLHNLFTLLAVLLPLSIFGQKTVVCDFNTYSATTALDGTTNPAIAVYNGSIDPQSGTASVVFYTGTDNGVSTTSYMLRPLAAGTAVGGSGAGVINFTSFPSAADYSVTWKEYHTGAGSKGGILLRGVNGSAIGSRPGLLSGYFFTTISGTEIAIRPVTEVAGTTTVAWGTHAKVVAAAANACRWYRASAKGSTLSFEYSDDGTTFTTGVTVKDTTYPSAGTTQLVWGLGGGYEGQVYYDNITYSDISTTGAH